MTAAASAPDMCGKGLHEMTGDNVRWKSADHGLRKIRYCRECNRASRREYRRVHGEAINEKRRREYARGVGRRKRPAAPEFPEYMRLSAYETEYRGRRAGGLATEWPGVRGEVACKGIPVDGFFSLDGEPGQVPQRRHLANAYRLCGGCPLASICDERATESQEVGLWGGKWRYRRPRNSRYVVVDLLHEEYPA
ncbi:WhiB family transcriptional regulator [Saccharopolyspora hattusasensis]|uniref:WhiB family transcriptional regulator n=1 Tax=Saccharopolyspora hattusasensis TaxID=1128679 RepID=UPI003D98F03B